MEKFTKGEWKIVNTNNNRNLSTVCKLSPNWVIMVDGNICEDLQHDARLIASAPEMYAALKMIQIEGGLSVARHKQVDKVLAKARGESCGK